MSFKRELINQLGEEWCFELENEFKKSYMLKLQKYVYTCRTKGIVYPESSNVFKAFRLTPINKVRVIWLGQDPYPNGYADGLAFSSAIGWECPASLSYILRAIEAEIYYGLNINLYNRFDLNHLAEQGFLLLNSRLTVNKNNPNSHANIGWELFIKAAIDSLNKRNKKLIYVLMGSSAKQFQPYINKRDEVVMCEHPAAASYKGTLDWNNNKCFTKINEFLYNEQSKDDTQRQIEWCNSSYYEKQGSNEVTSNSEYDRE